MKPEVPFASQNHPKFSIFKPEGSEFELENVTLNIMKLKKKSSRTKPKRKNNFESGRTNLKPEVLLKAYFLLIFINRNAFED